VNGRQQVAAHFDGLSDKLKGQLETFGSFQEDNRFTFNLEKELRGLFDRARTAIAGDPRFADNRSRMGNLAGSASPPVQPQIAALPPGGSLSGTALDGRWQVKVDVDPGSCRSAGGLFSGNVTIAGGKFSTSFRRAGQRVYLKGDFNGSESRLWGEAELIFETVHDFVGTVKVTGDTISKRIRSAPARGCRANLDITMTRIRAN